MTIRSTNTPYPFPPSIPPTLLSKYTNLETYIRTTNPAPNGSQDLSKVHRGDIISLEGSPCEVTWISDLPTGRVTLVEGTSLIDDKPYAARFNNCYGIRVGTYTGRPELRPCLVTEIRETERGTFISLQHTPTTTTTTTCPTCPHCHQPSPSSSSSSSSSSFKHHKPTPTTTTTTFEIPLPTTELGFSTHRQYNYSLRHPCLRAFALVSIWDSEEEQEEREQEQTKKMLGFRLSTEREWHAAPGSSHWCEDCEAA